MLVLLHGILLPFAVGLALAYLLVPAVDQLEWIGINRGLAALILTRNYPKKIKVQSFQ
jgi:predicted PurR-regulated permease PerM